MVVPWSGIMVHNAVYGYRDEDSSTQHEGASKIAGRSSE